MMTLIRYSGLFIILMMIGSLRSMAQPELYQVGFELYKGASVEFSDIVYCNFETGGNAGIDNNDLPKFNQFNENISVYRDTGVNAVVRDFGIETRPLVNCTDTIQLRLYKTPTTTTNFRLVVDMNLYPATSGLIAVLQDKFLNTERPLKFGDTTNIFFTITSNASTTGFRFRVVFRRTQVTTAPFTQIPAICRGEAINLPATSSNGVKGTWTPAVNNTATTSYTFIPSEGQCATSSTMTVTVNQPVSPTFTQVQPVCSGGTFTLPTSSNNGITGNWLPAINNTQTTAYTFTPSQGLCATTAAMTVTVNQRTTPIFSPIGPFISGTNFTLPSTSENGINGSWLPAINNTQTTTYTFTPDAGQCAGAAQLTVMINDIPTSVVDLNGNKNFKLYPNPMDKGVGILQLELSNYVSGNYVVSVYSICGVRLRDLYLQHRGGTATFSLSVDQRWLPGVYLIRVSGDKNIKSQNILFMK